MASNNFRAAAYLRKLAKSGAASVNVCFGICWHLRHWMRANGVNSLVLNGHRYYDGYSVVEHGAQDWAHYSGSKSYPVPGKYHSNPDKWDGDTGALRRDLCLHLANKLEE